MIGNISAFFYWENRRKLAQKKFWQDISRHPAKHVNLKSNTIMKKPRCKYKKEIKTKQIISIKNKKIFFYVKLKARNQTVGNPIPVIFRYKSRA